MARFFLCLAAAACCCLALLLVPPVQGRLGIGMGGGSGGRDDDPLHGTTSKFNAAAVGATNRQTAEEVQRGSTTMKATPAWSSSWTAAAAGRLRPELRSVPGGPDPLHHHGSPWRPELEPTTP